MSATRKRDAIHRVGRSLFLRHGVRKVRVEEICADAGVSKRTFYKYFRDKEALATAVLGELFEQGRSRLEAVLSSDAAVEDKVRQIIAAKTELASETSAVFYREALDEATEFGRFALREQRRWDERVRRFYRDAQTRGQIRGDIDIDLLMALLVRLRDLVKEPDLLRLASGFPHLVENVMSLVFYGIIPRTSTDRGAGPRNSAEPRRRKS